MSERMDEIDRTSDRLAEAVAQDRRRRDDAHTCLTGAGSPTCLACQRDRNYPSEQPTQPPPSEEAIVTGPDERGVQ